MVVDSVVRHCMSLTVKDEYATHKGLGIVVGRSMGVFYADCGMIRSMNP